MIVVSAVVIGVAIAPVVPVRGAGAIHDSMTVTDYAALTGYAQVAILQSTK